jgi:lysyl-tRNA synthetase class 1
MYLDKSGEKISKSKGNVFTPQMWFRYGSPQSLILMTLKRFEGTRSLSINDIPLYMDELDDLEARYRGLIKEKDPKRLLRNQSLFEYTWWLQVPVESSVIENHRSQFVPVSYNLLSQLSRYTPKSMEITEFVRTRLEDYDLVKTEDDWNKIKSKVVYAKHWVEDFVTDATIEITLDQSEREALRTLVREFDSMELRGEEIQSVIFKVSKMSGMKPRDLFSLLYTIYIGQKSGPRMWKLIELMGSDAIDRIRTVLS